MEITVFKPNMEVISAQAEKIRKDQESKGDFPDLQYYKWKIGDNHLRFLPPWSASGLISKRQSNHYKLPPDDKIVACYTNTWPSKYDVCPICEVIEKILAMFPDLDLRRQGSSDQYRLNIIDRDDEDKGPQIIRVTPAINNWLILQMDKAQIGDVTDIETGVDVIVTLEVKKGKDGNERKRYTPSFVPRPCPLHEDDEIVAKWVTGMFDLDRVFHHPKDEDVVNHRDYASKMLAYYTRKYRSSGVGMSSGNGERQKAPEPRESEEIRDPAPRDPSPRDPAPSSLDGLDPREMPSCFAGHKNPEPHSGPGVPAELEGEIGYFDELEKCMLCEHELRCIDAKASRG